MTDNSFANTFLNISNPPNLLPRHRDVPARQAGKETLARDAASGKVHFFNSTAALIWECCDGKTSFEECANRLREKFEVPADTDLAADIRKTIADFAQQELLDA